MTKQVSSLGLSIKIWLTAVAFNTFIGTLTLTVLEGSELMGLLLLYGTLYGFAVSLPAPVLLYLLFQGCTSYNFTGTKIWRMTLLGAAGCGIIAWLVYMNTFRGLIDHDWLFLALAILCGLAATATQHNSIRKLGYPSETVEEFLS